MFFATRRGIATFTAVVLSLSFPAAAATTLDAANAQARELVQQTMKDQRIPGLQVAVVKDGRLVLSEQYGWANVENQLAVTETTRFPLNSATKSFTGVAMMQLAQAGRVDLAAPISRYLQDLPPAWQGIRVRQLLAHTSGLPDLLDEQGLIGGGSEQAAWQAVQRLPMEAPIGDKFMYNQTNYVLLARIIAKQSGMPYEQFIAERQFAKVGMPSAIFGDSYDLIPNAATMYSYFPRKTDAEGDTQRLSHWFYDMTPGLWAGGGIQTTASEVANWLIALSNDRLINAVHLREMWTPEKLNSGADGSWAAGWPVLAGLPHRQVAGMGGARAAFIVYPDDGVAVVVLTNLVGSNPQNFIPRIAALYKSSPSPSPSSSPSPSRVAH
ncbi:MAG TPA: serine hydrolase domain-containing protein [Stenotrophomonas sp.]|jgi:CubicO group peptidase (beta-lactamase class C family)